MDRLLQRGAGRGRRHRRRHLVRWDPPRENIPVCKCREPVRGLIQGTDLNDDAIAARLSYFLWNSEPDDTLRALAERGELRRPEVLRAQTERLLNDPKSRRFVEALLRPAPTVPARLRKAAREHRRRVGAH